MNPTPSHAPKRYMPALDKRHDIPCMVEVPDGNYISCSDYELVKKQLDETVSVSREIPNENGICPACGEYEYECQCGVGRLVKQNAELRSERDNVIAAAERFKDIVDTFLREGCYGDLSDDFTELESAINKAKE